MIKKSFILLDGISDLSERNIWKQGIPDWTTFCKREKIKGISMQRKYYYNRELEKAQQALYNNDPYFFVNKLPAKEMWRLYPQFKENCCFVDLEIDSYGKIVVVGVATLQTTNFFVRHVNLEEITQEFTKYKLIITFNGASFDIPKLRKQFHINLPLPHIDLKPLCVNLNLKGGLKEIEKKLGFRRPAHLYGNPVELWKAFHASGDKEYLGLLLEYNREDCENLIFLMEYVYKKLFTLHSP